MTPMTNSVKACRCFEGLISETNNFAFEVKVKMMIRLRSEDIRMVLIL